MRIRRLGIVGAGAWGTALAIVARRAGSEVTLWARSPQIASGIGRAHQNALYLPDIPLDAAIRPTVELAEAAAADAILLAVPAQRLRAVAERLAPHLGSGLPIVICAKGLEQGTGRLMTEIVGETLPGRPQAVLSGPTFAAEVARGLPTAVTLAAADPVLGRALVEAIGTRRFRLYLSDDPLGAEIGGAVKNVLAIACGIVIGRRLGDNARAALVTRGLAEMVRFGVALGGRAETLMGLSGLGDLTLTCCGRQSRNLALGVGLGEGRSLAEALAGRRSVVEGVTTAPALLGRARDCGVEMPISAAADAILHHGAGIDDTIAALLARPFAVEAAAP